MRRLNPVYKSCGIRKLESARKIDISSSYKKSILEEKQKEEEERARSPDLSVICVSI